MIRELSLEELGFMDDGRVVEAFRQAVQRVAMDIDDRPGVDTPRKVTIELRLTPKLDTDGQLDDVKAVFHVKDSVPERKTKAISCDLRKLSGNKRQIVFNDLSADNVRQRTIDEIEGGE